MSEIRNNNFIFTANAMPETAFALQSVNIPSFSIGGIPIPSPMLDYPIPGDKIAFGTFSFEFIVDEDLSNYKEMWNWVNRIAAVDRTNNPVETIIKNMFSDCTVTILSNNKNPITSITFVDCFPQTVGDLQFNLAGNSANIICPVSMEFSYFKFD